MRAGRDVVSGSSPLARGLPRRTRQARTDRRIIPARAGFTRPTHRSWGPCTDHPRSRGVYSGHRYPYQEQLGSSPLARGLPGQHGLHYGPCGIIPARAGFTGCGYLPVLSRGDHPRSRGVYDMMIIGELDGLGSSPLARGLRRASHTQINRSGIIPARAGFTIPNRIPVRTPADHPRSRGVYRGGIACEAWS